MYMMHTQISLNLIFLHLFPGYWTTFRPDPTTWTTLRPDPTTWTTFRPDLTTTNNKVKPHNKIKQTPYGIIVGTVMGVLLLLVLVICLAWHRSRKQKQYMITYSARETGMYFHDHRTSCSLTGE